MISKALIPFIYSLVLLSSVNPTSSLPTLYDVVNEGAISPLMPGDGSQLNGYVRDLMASAAPAEKGATVTKYEVQEVFSALALPISNSGHATYTILPGAITHTYTMNQGASTLHISAPPSVITAAGYPFRIKGSVKDCSLDLAKRQGVCVEEGQVPVVTVITGSATTTTSTYTSTWTSTYTRPLEKLNISSGSSIFTMSTLRSSVFVGLGLLAGIMMV